MGSKTFKKIAAPLAILALGVLPASAAGTVHIDYSKNGASGVYAPEVVHKNYSMNGATGDYVPTANTPAPVTPGVQPAKADDGGFAWGAAAIGALSTLLVVMLVVMTTRVVRRRRVAPPTPARPSAA